MDMAQLNNTINAILDKTQYAPKFSSLQKPSSTAITFLLMN